MLAALAADPAMVAGGSETVNESRDREAVGVPERYVIMIEGGGPMPDVFESSGPSSDEVGGAAGAGLAMRFVHDHAIVLQRVGLSMVLPACTPIRPYLCPAVCCSVTKWDRSIVDRAGDDPTAMSGPIRRGILCGLLSNPLLPASGDMLDKAKKR